MPDFLTRPDTRCNLSTQLIKLIHTRTRKQRQWSYCVPPLTSSYVPLDGLHCCWYMHTNEEMIYAISTDTLNAPISQHISPARPPQAWPVKESRAGHGETSAWLSSHNRKHLKPVEQMFREDLRRPLRPGAINQPLSAAARLHVMITANDKYYYWPICKTWHS